MRDFRIAVLPGDGIGREVMAPCLTLLEAVTSATSVRLRLDSFEAGAELLGTNPLPASRWLPASCLARCSVLP